MLKALWKEDSELGIAYFCPKCKGFICTSYCYKCKEKINTEPLQQAAAQSTYQKAEEVVKEKAGTTKKTVTVSKPKEEKIEKSFFSMFNPKPKPQAESDISKDSL